MKPSGGFSRPRRSTNSRRISWPCRLLHKLGSKSLASAQLDAAAMAEELHNAAGKDVVEMLQGLMQDEDFGVHHLGVAQAGAAWGSSYCGSGTWQETPRARQDVPDQT